MPYTRRAAEFVKHVSAVVKGDLFHFEDLVSIFELFWLKFMMEIPIFGKGFKIGAGGGADLGTDREIFFV